MNGWGRGGDGLPFPMAKRAPAVECFPNPSPDRDFLIVHTHEEFTSMCPKTGHPDFGDIEVSYVADKKCLELKSLKMYFQSFRTRGIFYEAVTNEILDHLVSQCRPRWMEVRSNWKGRGGFKSVITCTFTGEDDAKRGAKT